MTSRFMTFAAAFVAVLSGASADDLNFVPLKSSGIYAIGEKAGWKVTPASGVTDTYTYTVRANGGTEIAKGTIDPAKGPAEIAIALDHPAMLYVTVDRSGAPPPPPSLTPIKAHYAVLGAAVAPNKITPSAARPADFDAFWNAKREDLDKIPMNAALSEIVAPMPGIKMYKVVLDSLNSHVQGYLAVPATGGTHPAILIYQFAGVYALTPWDCASRAAQGWLCFDVSAHDMPPDAATGAPQDYPGVGNTSRETSYFLNMYLRDQRALDWVRTLPLWDRKTLVVNGGSQGGQQSLVMAGLNPGKVTAVVVSQPAGGDINAASDGRMPGFPNWWTSNPQIAQAAGYFDTVNFASKITAPVLVAIGFIDTSVPPSSVFAMANQIPAPHEIIALIDSEHGHITPDKLAPFYKRQEEVLYVLLHGGTFVPDETVARAP